MIVEAFENRNPTGILLLFQIKGHEGSFGSGDIVGSVPVRTLLYARMFQAPFFLVNVSLADNQAYFVWLQKYINTRLTSERPRWNKQVSVNIHFPRENLLDENGYAKIRSLVTYVTHRDMGVSFLCHLNWLQRHLNDFCEGGDVPSIEQALMRLREISKLEPFLVTYEDHCENLDLDEMRVVLEKAKSYRAYDHDDEEFVDGQLSDLRGIELMFLSQDDADTFVAENTDTGLPY